MGSMVGGPRVVPTYITTRRNTRTFTAKFEPKPDSTTLGLNPTQAHWPAPCAFFIGALYLYW